MTYKMKGCSPFTQKKPTYGKVDEDYTVKDYSKDRRKITGKLGWEGVATEISEEKDDSYRRTHRTPEMRWKGIAADTTKLSSGDFMKKYGITIAEYKTEQGSK